ncbi:MAG: SufB/SufD family protein [Acidilobus sp.]
MSSLRQRALEASKRTPWQRVADSPVTKYYTDWAAFEKALLGEGELTYERPSGDWDLVLGPCGAAYNYDIDETLLDIRSSRLYAEHIARLEGAHILEAKGTTRIALCSPAGASWASQHLTVNVPPGEEADIVVYAPRRAPGSTGVEVRVKEGARASLLVIGDPGPGAPTAYLLRRAVGVRASLSSLVMTSQSAMVRIDEQTTMAALSSLRHSSITLALSNARVDDVIDTVQEGRSSKADVWGFGVASDESLVSVRGTAVMLPNSEGSSSRFFVEALLIGRGARAYTMPMMRIETGNVEVASHRSAQYRLPLDELFYLETRGLTQEEATELIVLGRLQSLVEASGIPKQLTELASERLAKYAKEALGGA